MSLRSIALAIAFLVAFLAVGIPHWLVPYAKASLPDTLLGPGLLGVLAAATVLALLRTPFALALLVPGIAVPAAVMARVVVDVLHDKTSHNLWPFEVVIASAVGIPVALAGALLGWLVAKALRRG